MPSRVSNVLPNVSMVTVPDAGAVHAHHTDFPPAFPACFGSPASFVAFTFVPEADTDEPWSRARLTKLSLAGAVVVVEELTCWTSAADVLGWKSAAPAYAAV